MDDKIMKRLQQLTKEINDLTVTIKEKHPELYKYLDENPITLPNEEDPEMGIRSFSNYLESLKQLLKHYVENQEKALKKEVSR